MPGISAFLRRHTLGLGFAAVLLPLTVMLGLQYVWLAKLERMSALAHKAALNNYVEGVGTKVQYFYRSEAERALNIPASYLVQNHTEKIAHHWKKTAAKGSRLLFVVDYTQELFGRFLVLDPERQELVSPPASEEAMAIIVACSPWQLLRYRGVPVEAPALNVDERNPDYRIILKPITDDSSRLVGVAGMILDETYFRNELLPAALRKALPAFFSASDTGRLVVTVRDRKNEVVLAMGEGGTEGGVSAHFPFVFADWSIGLANRGATPEQYARVSFVMNMSLFALLAVGLVGGVVLTLRAAKRAMKLSEMKSDFVSNVSHELRTPLASIRVFAELLKLGRAATAEKAQEYGAYIESESRRLTRLIDNILDFARIESGRKTYRFVPADLAEVVSATLGTFDVRLRDSGFRITCTLPDAPLPPVEMDADAIAQALHNLLDNAVKYSGDSREIEVSLGLAGSWGVVAITDHGIGIAPDEQRRIFERFHRVGTGLVHDVKGSGLGLSIVRHIVQAHHGELNVESEPGRGSTFRIRLPVEAGRVVGPERPAGEAKRPAREAAQVERSAAGTDGAGPEPSRLHQEGRAERRA